MRLDGFGIMVDNMAVMVNFSYTVRVILRR